MGIVSRESTDAFRARGDDPGLAIWTLGSLGLSALISLLLVFLKVRLCRSFRSYICCLDLISCTRLKAGKVQRLETCKIV